jgi:antitoxin YqcF
MINWGEKYFDHYTKYFGQAKERSVFEYNEKTYSIQILSFENVIENTKTFCSLGLSHYYQEIGEIAEITITTDKYWEFVPKILANTLFFIIQQKMQMGWGMNIGGLKSLAPEFIELSKKHSIYFTNPFSFPSEVCSVKANDFDGKIYEAFFISPQEKDFFMKNGAVEFERFIESKDIDPYHVQRASSI